MYQSSYQEHAVAQGGFDVPVAPASVGLPWQSTDLHLWAGLCRRMHALSGKGLGQQVSMWIELGVTEGRDRPAAHT